MICMSASRESISHPQLRWHPKRSAESAKTWKIQRMACFRVLIPNSEQIFHTLAMAPAKALKGQAPGKGWNLFISLVCISGIISQDNFCLKVTLQYLISSGMAEGKPEDSVKSTYYSSSPRQINIDWFVRF